ncbi:MAG: type I 3-dehydroquinate dehydratase, partial [Planctomycetota bacterium]
MTAIVASTLLERPDDSLVEQRSRESKAAGAHMLELRVDSLLGADDDETASAQRAQQLADAVAASTLPVIVTCRPAWEGGLCEAPEAARLALFERLAQSSAPPAYVDIELRALTRHAPWRGLLERLVQRAQQEGQPAT